EVDHHSAADVPHRVAHRAATGNEAVRRFVCGNLSENLVQNPTLRRCQVAMWRGEFPHATALLRHLEPDVVGHGGCFGMEREPAQTSNRKVERLRQVPWCR